MVKIRKKNKIKRRMPKYKTWGTQVTNLKIHMKSCLDLKIYFMYFFLYYMCLREERENTKTMIKEKKLLVGYISMMIFMVISLSFGGIFNNNVFLYISI